MAEILPLFSTPVYIDYFNPKNFDFSVIEKIPVREVCQGNGYISKNQKVIDLLRGERGGDTWAKRLEKLEDFDVKLSKQNRERE